MLLFRVFLTSGKVVVRIRPPMRSPKTRGQKGPIQKLSHKKYSTIVLNIRKPTEWERHGTGRLSENEKNERPPIPNKNEEHYITLLPIPGFLQTCDSQKFVTHKNL